MVPTRLAHRARVAASRNEAPSPPAAGTRRRRCHRPTPREPGLESMTAGYDVRRRPAAGLGGRRGLFGVIVVLLVAGAVSAWRIQPRAAPASVSSNMKVRAIQGPATLEGRPVLVASESARLVPPSEGPCRSADLSLRVVPTSPPDRNG